MGPDEVVTVTPKLNIDSSASLGKFYFLCVADLDGEIAEVDETNNVKATEVFIHDDSPDEQLPDLVIEDASISANTGTFGDVLNIKWTAKNVGPVDAGKSTLAKYYISRDDQWDSRAYHDGGDIWLRVYDKVNALAVNETGDEEANVRIPSTISSGNWSIAIVIDANKELREQIESNNFHSFSIEVKDIVVDEGEEESSPSALPDLIPLSFEIENPIVQRGEKLAFKLSVANNGTLDASKSSRIKYYFQQGGEGGKLVYRGYDNVGALSIGEVSEEEAAYSIKDTYAFGPWNLWAFIDGSDAVAELDEENNAVLIGKFIISDGSGEIDSLVPDIKGTLSTDSMAPHVPGERISATLSLEISGNASAIVSHFFRINWYLASAPFHTKGVDAFLKNEIVSLSEFVVGN